MDRFLFDVRIALLLLAAIGLYGGDVPPTRLTPHHVLNNGLAGVGALVRLTV